MCLDKLGYFGYNFSTVDFVKDVATYCGWNGEKTPRDRKFLSDLKDLLAEWNDVPYRKVREDIAKIYLIAEQYNLDHNKFVIFVHCREPEEIKRFVKDYDATTVIVRRPEVENVEQTNHADSNVFNYEYDVTIWNGEDLDHLKLVADFFLDKLLKF